MHLPPFTDAQRRRVTAALESHDISALASPEELHQFMLHYNWGDGYDAVRAVTTHPLCDRGTALWTYWVSGPMSLQYATRDDAPDYHQDGYDTILALERRLLSNDFKHARIRVDPRNFFEPGEDVTRAHPDNLWKRPPPLQLTLPTPGEPMPPDDLEYELTPEEKEARERELDAIAAAGWHDLPQLSPEEKRRRDEEEDRICLQDWERRAREDPAWQDNLESFRQYFREKYGLDSTP